MFKNVIVAMVLSLGLLSVKAQDSTEAMLVNKWVMEGFSINGGPVITDNSKTLTFNADKTYEGTFEGQKDTGKWAYDAATKTITVADINGALLGKFKVMRISKNRCAFEVDESGFKMVTHFTAEK